MSKFTHSLSFKLSFSAGLVLFLTILVFAYHSIRTQENQLIGKVVQGALKDSEVIKAAVWNGMMTKDREVIRQIVDAIGSQGAFERVDIFDARGVLRYSSREAVNWHEPEVGTDPMLRNLATDTSVRHRVSEDGRWIDVVNPLLNNKSCSAAACHGHPESEKVLGALAIKIPLRGLREEIYAGARTTALFAFLLFLFISTMLGLAVIFLINPNLRRLQEQAARMARGEYIPPVPTIGSDEIADLTRSFDEAGRRVFERTTRLTKSRKLYKSLFEEVPCYLTVVDRDYKIVRANRAFTDQFGNQVGRQCFTGYKGLESRCRHCPVEKTFADGSSHESEEVWQIDGRDAYVIVKTAPIYDDEGIIAEVLEMSLDVTELKQLQLELRKKQREFKYLFQNVPCYLTVVDRDFNIVQANTLFQRDFGDYSERKCFNVYKNKNEKCPHCPVERTFADGLSHQSEEVWLRNGDETYVIVNTAPVLDEHGSVKAVMEMSTNITEVKRLQGELALLGETIAGMSHTIKNILAGLQGGVYVVDSGLQRGREDKLRAGWEMVKRNVQKVSELVKGILYASKEREPEYKECDPAQIMADVCDLYETRANSQGVALIRSFPHTMDGCSLDPAGIHSALSNLVSNALDACRWAGGADEHHVVVSGSVVKDYLVMKVTDDGRGMPDEVKEKLFSKFYSTKGSGGTGLGLAITRKVVREHGGSIKVDSEPGKGTCFTIEIPVVPASGKEIFKKAV